MTYRLDATPPGRKATLILCRVIGVGQAVFAAVVFFTRFAEPAEFIAAIMVFAAALTGFFTPWLLKRIWKRQGF